MTKSRAGVKRLEEHGSPCIREGEREKRRRVFNFLPCQSDRREGCRQFGVGQLRQRENRRRIGGGGDRRVGERDLIDTTLQTQVWRLHQPLPTFHPINCFAILPRYLNRGVPLPRRNKSRRDSQLDCFFTRSISPFIFLSGPRHWGNSSNRNIFGCRGKKNYVRTDSNICR